MSVLLRQVTLRNYRSIGQCKVDLSRIECARRTQWHRERVILSTRLRLVTESLSETLDYAIRQRGGISEKLGVVLAVTPATSLSVTSDSVSNDNVNASFAFRSRSSPTRVVSESSMSRLISRATDSRKPITTFRTDELRKRSPATWRNSLLRFWRIVLYLGAVSGSPVFRPLFDALSTDGVLQYKSCRNQTVTVA